MARKTTKKQERLAIDTSHADPMVETHGPQVIEHVESGHTQRAAAALVGIREATISEWKKKGQEEIAAGHFNGKYAKWLQEFQRASGRFLAVIESAYVQNAKRGNVTAQQGILQRRYPDLWSNDIKVAHTGAVGVGVLDLTGKSDEDLRRMVAENLTKAQAHLDES